MAFIYKIPNNYRKNDKETRICYLRGYEHFFYANLDELLSDADFDDWVISVFKGGTEVDASIGVLTKDIISGTDYRYYCAFTISESLAAGEYYFAIYNSDTLEVKYVSNCIRVITSDEIENFVMLSFRNSTNIFNFNYSVVNNYNTLFLEMNLIEQQPEVSIKNTKEQSSGVIRNQKFEAAKTITLEGYYFDDEINDMMLALSGHDDIIINGQSLTVKTAWKIETNQRNSVQKGTIEFYDPNFSEINYRN